MSIRHNDHDHYASWLGTRGEAQAFLDPWLGQPLVPRSLYGEYLAHTAEKAIAELRERGWRVSVVTAAVVGATAAAGGRLALRTGDGREHVVGQVALCVGGGTPHDHYGLAAAPGFVGDPYPLARTLDEVPLDGDTAVIGSGLAAVDVAVSLAARGHTGRISLLSRTGVLPYVWQRPSAYVPRHVTVERAGALLARDGELTLHHLAGLLREEMAEAGEDLDALLADLRAARTEDPVARLRRQVAAIAVPETGRRVLQRTCHTVGPYVWRLLPERDRERLRAELRTVTSVASPMIPGNAARLLRLIDTGRLEMLAGVHDVTPHGGGFTVETGSGARRHADVVINAVNPPPHAVPRSAAGLVGALVGMEVAARHPAGGLVPADARVHVVGDLAGGGSFITSSIPAIAGQGAAAARAILAASETRALH
jgi:uncharacterized NAD(P)/FAD-binding protein YdhS